MSTSIEILKTVKPPLRWVPVQGDCTTEFLQSKSNDANGPNYDDLTVGSSSILQEAQRILGRCLPPFETTNPETGLVVGYVQSGKTLSFETVIALARDNGFGVVIVIAGTKNNLRDQSEDRLKKDFGIEDGSEHWCHLSNPTMSVRSQIETRLNAWQRNPAKKALLITVLKHGGHLEKLAKVLDKFDLKTTPCLIIDDESDQASLNTNAARIRDSMTAIDDFSTTYKSILTLRDVLPHHSYLQYTATPQANLLLAQTDLLNPNFAELVTPGDAYTGGKAFFLNGRDLIIEIPSEQVPSSNNELTNPPKTLLEALRLFLLAASHHSLTREKKTKAKDRNRSMMVHPAIKTASHKQYKLWLDKALKTFKVTMERQSKIDPIANESLFKKEYDALARTFPQIRPLSELIAEMIEEVFIDLYVVEINGTKDAEEKVNWKGTKYWILVGGAKLDRGYTVEGLCTTYMPRPLGSGAAADSLQQRARFFGYKSSYLGLCRVFIQKVVREAFSQYIEHEEFIRDALANHRGQPLSSWRRDFVLTELLKPTRANVIGINVRRVAVKGWVVPSALQRDDNAAQNNRILLSQIVPKWQTKYGTAKNAASIITKAHDSPHDVIIAVPLEAILADFLLNLQVRDLGDAAKHSGILIALSTMVATDPSQVVDVFLMNRLETVYRSRVSRHPYASINQYFSQSANSVNDRDYFSNDRISLQLRKIDLGTVQRDQSKADIKDITWFALHVPERLRKALLVEEER
ncbi:MAG: hypothetical protein NVS3B3_03540 [Aquirhabdus sp.]